MQELAKRLAGKVSGAEINFIKEVTCNSKEVVKGGVFVAIKGLKVDGHDFVDAAYAAGAALCIVEREDVLKGRTGIVVKDSRAAYSKLAAIFSGEPSKQMFTIGVTGTNGKTTIHALVYQILEKCGVSTIRIGTIGYKGPNMFSSESLTTPEPLTLQKTFAEAYKNGAKAAVIEVSSHALTQARVADIDFNVGIFTNLTRDHLDYHGTMENYFEAKKTLFTMLSEKTDTLAVINGDDEYGKRLLTYCKEVNLRALSYGTRSECDLRISDFKEEISGSCFNLNYCGKVFNIQTEMIGLHNAFNLVAAIAAVEHYGIDLEKIISLMGELKSVCGRLEPVGANGIGVYVDYSHTPDAMLRALQSLRQLPHNTLWVVFGCGGDRDKGKRPQMMQVAKEYADNVVVTSDNPRTEDPNTIIDEILQGGSADIVEADRRKAIKKVLSAAKAGDIVLIAGKGHEDYQIIGTTKYHLSDQEEVRKFFGENEAL